MGGIAVLQGPKPPADCPLGFCVVCSGIGKFTALAAIRAEIEAHERTGEGTRTWVLDIPREYLSRAVAWTVIAAMGVAGPVCWTHLTAVQPMSGGIIPVQGALPPGLDGGHGNIPLLGGGPQ